MGKGDPRTKRGKIFRHSYGKYRARKDDSSINIPVSNETVEVKVEEVVEVKQVVASVPKVKSEDKPKKPAAKKATTKKPAAAKTEETAE